jgi:hypothetical protein
MGVVRRARPGLLSAALVVGASACASIWGFQDAVDLPDGGEDAGVDVTSAEGGSDGTASDGDAGEAAASDAPGETASDASGEAAAPCAAACIPAVPPGWQGPLEIYEGAGGPPPPTPPSCAGAYPSVAYDGNGSPVAPAATCSCSCGAPSGVVCDPPLANYFSDNTCAASCGTKNQPIASTCTPLGLGGCGGTHITIGSSVASGGTCAPDAGSQVPAPAWMGDVRLCAPSGSTAPSGCDAGEVCAPTTDLPFEPSTYCIARNGTWTCPAGFSALRTYYQSSVDTRACTPCTCGAPSGATCTGGTCEASGSTSCQGGSFPLSVPQACANLGALQAALISGLTSNGGSCAPDGGQPTGTFTPTTPTTICCTQ